MELSDQINLMLNTVARSSPTPEISLWINRFVLGIDRTEKSFDDAFRSTRLNLKPTWTMVFVATRAWYDTFRSCRHEGFKQEGLVTCLKYLDAIFQAEGVPQERYKL